LAKDDYPTRDVLWKSLDEVRLEHSRFSVDDEGPYILGSVLAVDRKEPVTIDYIIECDPDWVTGEVTIEVLRTNPNRESFLSIVNDGEGDWSQLVTSFDGLGSRKLPKLKGCLDVDLAFSPVTNTLPIRRLGLDIGEGADVNAAWIQFPSLEVTVLPQRYTRIADRTYRYESFLSGFTALLEVDDLGLVKTYEGLWERVAEASPPGSIIGSVTRRLR
jgi:hypothetical protein